VHIRVISCPHFGRVACLAIALEIVNIQIECLCVLTIIIECLKAQNMQNLWNLEAIGHLDKQNQVSVPGRKCAYKG
jgi:hypothetical protein